MMRFGGNLSYPFRSREVRDICEHLTPEEDRRLRAQAWRSGLIMGSIFGGLQSLLVYWLLMRLMTTVGMYFPRGFIFLVLFSLVIPLGLLFGLITAAPTRKRISRILCETEYGKQMGFTSEKLALYGPFETGRRGSSCDSTAHGGRQPGGVVGVTS